MLTSLTNFLQNSPTAYHACDNAKEILLAHGFTPLYETEDWDLSVGGKYFIERGGSSLIAFTVGDLEEFAFKIAAAHLDSPALKVKENGVMRTGAYATLNTEKYGGGIWYSFFDRPLKLAGRVVKREGEALKEENVLSPFTVVIPSLSIHQNRDVNESFSINPQVDLLPLVGLSGESLSTKTLLEKTAGEGVLSYDLFLVNADLPYSFGVSDEFLASPRVDNLAGALAAIEGLIDGEARQNVSVVALLDNEEVGSLSPQGADGDFLETTLKRIAYALRFDDNEYYKAIAASFLLSLDNAHATHPNHPEKYDPTNTVALGGGVVIKSHASRAYITDAKGGAIVKAIFDGAGVPYQTFFNRSDMQSGSTLGRLCQRHVSILGADVGMAQLAMHSACECFAKADYLHLAKGVKAYFSATVLRGKNQTLVR